jgi:hypothetical protein
MLWPYLAHHVPLALAAVTQPHLLLLQLLHLVAVQRTRAWV